MKSILCSSLVLSCSLLVPALASAQDANTDANVKGDVNVNSPRPSLPAVSAASPAGRFGDKKQLAISSDAGLELRHTSVSGQEGSTTTITLHPALDYFVLDNVSVGGFIGLDHTSASGRKTTIVSIGPRVGYNLTFSERFSFWPKVGLSYANVSTKEDPIVPGGPSVDDSNGHLAFNVFAPVMFHPVQHFFLGFGPYLDTDLTGDAKTTSVGARLTIGGWLD